MKRVLPAIVVLLLMLQAVPARAGQAESGTIVITGPITLLDVPGHWAERPIGRLMAKLIAFGFLDLTFRPDKPMSRLDTAIMLVRVAGLEPLARRLAGSPLDFSDTELLTSLERGYVAAAESVGLMVGDGETLTFRPYDTITRHEVAVVVIRALGLEAAAQARADGPLPFRDEAAIPSWARAHVGMGVERQLLLGYPETDGTVTWRGSRDVTRAEVTAILSRIDEQIDSIADAREVSGTVAAHAGMSLTLDGDRTYQVAADARIDAEVEVGAKVVVVLNDNGQAILVEAREQEPHLQRWSGSITALGEGTLRLASEGSGNQDIAVDSSTAVYVDGRQASLTDLAALQFAAVTVQAGVALEIRATTR